MKPTIKRPRPNAGKLRELILHIAMRSEDDESFGAAKLNRMLFYADFLAYKKFGSAITWQEYQVQPQGPCPRELLSITRKMKLVGELGIQVRDYFGVKQHRPIALREANLDLFEAREISLVDSIIQKYRGKNVSELSADLFIGWELARRGETIPYAIALVGKRALTPREEEHARSLEHAAKVCLESNGQ